MKKILILLFILSLQNAFSQDFLSQAKTDLGDLYDTYKQKSETFISEKKLLDDMIDSLDTGATKKFEKIRMIKKSLDSIIEKEKSFKSYYQSKKVPKDILDKAFPETKGYKELNSDSKNSEEKSIYVLYGNNKIAEEKEVFKDEKIKDLFKDTFNINSETCLGTFEIPGNGQKILLYRTRTKDDKKANEPQEDSDYIVTKQTVYFDHVKFSVREGRIYDIRVRTTNKEHTQQYYFENDVPISLLKYPQGSKSTFLDSSQNTSEDINNVTSDSLNKFSVRLSDVLSYFANPGNNFVPDDVAYTFPTDNEKNPKDTHRRVYKINQDTNLQNVMELRTYTDFLGLFDETANGIVQVEGKADFYIAPFQTSNFRPYTYANKISPYVHFTRLDKEHKGLTVKQDTIGKQFSITKPLEIIEKSYLDMGLTLDAMDFAIRKEYPFSVNLYFAMRYQIATILKKDLLPDSQKTISVDSIDTKAAINFKSLGLGAGVRLEFKRFNNFGFFYSPELIFYNHLNRIDTLQNPENFWLFRNEAEIYYFPGETKKQSIFLRLRTYLNVTDGEDSFFQLQFGYRFAVGLGNVKSKAPK